MIGISRTHTQRPGSSMRASHSRAMPATTAMSASSSVVWLSALIATLALVVASVGLFWQGGTGPETATSVRGATVELYGEGLYRYDSLFSGAGNKGTDAVTLFLGIPLLVLGIALYRRGSLRGGLLLMGALAWFLYAYASYALGAVAYNDLFLAYVVLFSAGLFALVLTFRSFDVARLPAHFWSEIPQRGLAIFLFASALVTLGVWLVDPVTALVVGEPPEGLRTSTTLFTHALDMAVIVPTVALAGWLVLRFDPLGYLIAFPLLVLEALLAPMIAAQTVSQISAGVEFTTGEIVGPITGFVVIAMVAIWFIVGILRNTRDSVDTSSRTTS